MKLVIKASMYLASLLALAGATALLFNTSENELSAAALFILVISITVIPSCADSIRPDVKNITIEQAADCISEVTIGKYIAKYEGKYLALVVTGETSMFRTFATKKECYRWIDGRSAT